MPLDLREPREKVVSVCAVAVPPMELGWALVLFFFLTDNAISESMLLVTANFLDAPKMQKSCLDNEKGTKLYRLSVFLIKQW